MRERIILLAVGLILILQPALAEAAACRLDQATFRPKYASEHFVLRTHRSGNNLLFGLVILKTNEVFRFYATVDEHTGEGMISSVPNSNGQDPGIKATFAVVDVKGLTTTPQDQAGYIAFQGLGRAFIDFRLREGQQTDPHMSPPSGLWEVTECRANRR
jgi:hypothetical protein